jgi:hypothetical protein
MIAFSFGLVFWLVHFDIAQDGWFQSGIRAYTALAIVAAMTLVVIYFFKPFPGSKRATWIVTGLAAVRHKSTAP